jgi:serine/threonine-protein kinase
VADDAHGQPDPIRFEAASSVPRIGRFELCGELGRGGMGVVYRAYQADLRRAVALKMILAGAHASDRQRAHFFREARLAAGLRHPNIVQVYEVGEQRDCPFIALEYMDGGSLARRLKQVRPTFRESAQLLETLARAVHFAHQSGVVHRDLKPANILLQRKQGLPLNAAALPAQQTLDGQPLTDSWLPKIADFGLAREFDTDATVTGQVAGTPCYMAPEQAEGRKEEQKPPVDIYGLGAILYELLTGRPPFKADSAAKTLELVKRTDPIAPRRFRPDVPRDLENICLKCLEKKPSDRYASAADLADDLARFQRDEPVQARGRPIWERGLRWIRRQPAAAVAALALATVLFTTATVLSFFQVSFKERPSAAGLRSIYRELRQGESVQLLGATGLPRWYRWHQGEIPFNLAFQKTQALRLKSWVPMMLELLPEPPLERFRIRGEFMYLEENGNLGHCGFYFSHAAIPAGKGHTDSFLAATFEHGPKAVGVHALFEKVDQELPADDSISRSLHVLRRHRFPLQIRQWKELLVEITPEGVRASWDGTWLQGLHPSEFITRDYIEEHLPLQNVSPPKYRPRGPIGIFVRNESVAIRNVYVEPLDPVR